MKQRDKSRDPPHSTTKAHGGLQPNLPKARDGSNPSQRPSNLTKKKEEKKTPAVKNKQASDNVMLEKGIKEAKSKLLQ